MDITNKKYAKDSLVKNVPSNIAITYVGPDCITGDEIVLLFAAVTGIMEFSGLDNVIESSSLGGNDHINFMVRSKNGSYDESVDTQILPSSNLNNEINTLLYLVVPSSSAVHGEELQLNSWYELLTDKLKSFGEPEIRLKECNQNVTEHIMFVCQGLLEGHWDRAIFGAVDSTNNQPTYLELTRKA